MMMDWVTWQHKNQVFYPWIAALVLGWLMVASASTGIAEDYTGNAAYFSLRHAVYLILGLLTTFVVSCIPLSQWRRFDVMLLLVGFIGLILVFAPVIGHTVNGSQRWLNLGIIKIQASEIAKLGVIFYLAGYLLRRQKEVQQQWSGFLKPLLILAVMVGLLLAEPDFGAVVVMMSAVMVMLFLGGVKAGQFFTLVIATGAIGYFVVTAEAYRVERLLAFIDPWAPDKVNSSGYQLVQSLIAFGRGDLFGTGFGESIQKLFYLPEAHTDFVFAIWAEETGLVGAIAALLVLVTLLAFIWNIAWKAQKAGLLYGAYIAAGIAMLLGMQVLINVGVNIGLLPTKGLTLPFYSYGGSSLLVCCAMIGIVMRIAYETEESEQQVDDVADLNTGESVNE